MHLPASRHPELLPSPLVARPDKEVEVVLDKDGTSVRHAPCTSAATKLAAVPESLRGFEVRSWSEAPSLTDNPLLRVQQGSLALLFDVA